VRTPPPFVAATACHSDSPAEHSGRGLMEYVRVCGSSGRTKHVPLFGPADGPPAVALHGLGGNTEQMLPALDAVAEHYGLRTDAIDLPHHCGSCTGLRLGVRGLA